MHETRSRTAQCSLNSALFACAYAGYALHTMTTEQPYVTWWGLGVTKLGTEAHCAHAVAMTDGVCAQITVCGKPVEGPVGGMLFDWTALATRCVVCAHVLSKPTADSEAELLCL